MNLASNVVFDCLEDNLVLNFSFSNNLVPTLVSLCLCFEKCLCFIGSNYLWFVCGFCSV